MLRVNHGQCLLTLCLIAACFLCVSPLTSQVQAASFAFIDVDKDGTGSAMMDIDIVGNTLTLTLDNTSPATLNSSADPNTPAILGFGFNIVPDLVPLSWSLTAYQDTSQTNLVTLGNSDGTATNWIMGTKRPNDIERDFLPQSGHNGSDRGIYNPDVITSALGSGLQFYSTARLVMTFATAPMLDGSVDPYVRMQRVGSGGSLKLFGTPTTLNSGPNAPEPTSLALFGIGMAFCSGYVIRRKQKNAAA